MQTIKQRIQKMNEITLAQFLGNESIFSRIQSLSPYPFFDNMSPEDMDTTLIINWGERVVYSKLHNLNLDKLASIINSLYGSNWEKLITINTLDFKSGAEKIVNETTNNNVISTSSNSTDNKVSAYNSDELVTDTKDVGSSNNTEDLTRAKQTSEKTIALRTAYDNLLLTQKTNILNTVLKDVSSYLTLGIY